MLIFTTEMTFHVHGVYLIQTHLHAVLISLMSIASRLSPAEMWRDMPVRECLTTNTQPQNFESSLYLFTRDSGIQDLIDSTFTIARSRCPIASLVLAKLSLARLGLDTGEDFVSARGQDFLLGNKPCVQAFKCVYSSS